MSSAAKNRIGHEGHDERDLAILVLFVATIFVFFVATKSTYCVETARA
jgi:hypothetical protein